MKILVLCSGGDAPGMNRFLFSLSKSSNEIYFAKAGFKGLVEGNIFPLDRKKVEEFKDEAGTVILTSRYPEFKEEKYFRKGLKKTQKFDSVVILGGNGSLNGAKNLFSNKVKTIFVPATIDNDVANSSYSIGFDSAVNQCVYVIQNTMPSINSHLETCLVEIMGNQSSAITRRVSEIVAPNYVVCEEKDLNLEKIKKISKENVKKEKGTLVLIKEKIRNINDIKMDLRKIGVPARAQIVGRLQRGGKPTKTELQQADKFAETTLSLIESGSGGKKIMVSSNGEMEILDL